MDKHSRRRRLLIRSLKFAIQGIILALVMWGIWRTVEQARGKMESTGVSLGQLHVGWLILSAFMYLVGMFPCSLFWHRVMLSMQQRPMLIDTLRAFFISQLGKYVPGKFLVVVLRTALIRGKRVDTTLAVASTFIETLTMMSIGAVIGAIALGFTTGDLALTSFAVVTAIAVGAPALPPVFRWAMRLTKLNRRSPGMEAALANIRVQSLGFGWLGIAAGWLCMGISLWATLRAIPAIHPVPRLPEDFLIVTACVTLSTVAGFASGLPGGLGVRELVVMMLVRPHFGDVAAVLSAIIHRCVMLVAEVIAAAVLFFMRGSADEASSAEEGQLPAEPGVTD